MNALPFFCTNNLAVDRVEGQIGVVSLFWCLVSKNVQVRECMTKISGDQTLP
jgi:hypothetical protein